MSLMRAPGMMAAISALIGPMDESAIGVDKGLEKMVLTRPMRRSKFNKPSRLWRGEHSRKYPGHKLRAMRQKQAKKSLYHHNKYCKKNGQRHLMIPEARCVDLW